MKHLSLDDIIEIYLGNSNFQGMEINESKEFAYQEIEKRTIEYRNANKIPELLSKLRVSLSQLPVIEKPNSITFIDNTYKQDISELSRQLETFCLKYFRPDLLDILSVITDITNKLDGIWEYDPEHLRYSSKFNDRRPILQSQEYYRIPAIEKILFTKSKLWRYQISATLGFDYILSIIQKSKESDIIFLPISFIDWDYNRKLVYNFIITFNALSSLNSFLWILFVTENQNQNQNRIDEIMDDIRIFSSKLTAKSTFHFNLIPYTIIERTQSGEFDFRVLMKDLEEFSNKYIA